MNNSLIRFRAELLDEITDAIQNEESGGIKELKFTELAMEYLEEAGETEGIVPCREIRENRIGNRIHKINGYAISGNHETIDLFITLFKGYDDIGRIYTDEFKTTINLATRFLNNLMNGALEGIEPTAPVNDLLKTVKKIRSEIVRFNIFILSDMNIPADAPSQTETSGIPVNWFVRDIEYLYRIHTSGSGRDPVNVDFVQLSGKTIPCIFLPEKNVDYTSYLAIMPATLLADIYEAYGARLLEQNVRTFLQFRGDINKGIRDTIIQKPHMFLAYNNGISATAENVELTPDKKDIKEIKDFQIVNGGQTTASIFQTRKRFKGTDISSVYVQMKLTLISDKNRKSEIVADISKYANTQNKVSEADLSSNDPFHIEIEQLSRKKWVASTDSGSKLSRWFYERARGQYNDELYNIDTPKKREKWQEENPKSRKFAKEDLARFHMSWEMKPWWVVRGRQKNFGQFMGIADDIDVNDVFFEDTIAKAIIFRECEKLYGTGAKAIGDLRYMVVPYTVAWLRYVTGNRINLAEIWRTQTLTSDFQNIIKSILSSVDTFMRKTAPGGLIGEWAKKDECWKELKKYNTYVDVSALDKFCWTEEELQCRYQNSTFDLKQRELVETAVKEIGGEGWIEIEQWGRATGKLEQSQVYFIWKIVRKIENNKTFSDNELKIADIILRIKNESK